VTKKLALLVESLAIGHESALIVVVLAEVLGVSITVILVVALVHILAIHLDHVLALVLVPDLILIVVILIIILTARLSDPGITEDHLLIQTPLIVIVHHHDHIPDAVLRGTPDVLPLIHRLRVLTDPVHRQIPTVVVSPAVMSILQVAA